MRPELFYCKWFSIVLVDPQGVINGALPVVGLSIIVFCIASFFFPFGTQFKETKQTIHGFGVDLEISVLSLFLLVGTLMSCTGIFLYLTNQSRDVQGLQHTIIELQSELKASKANAELAQHASLRFTLILPADLHQPPIQNLECWYLLASNPDMWAQASVYRGVGDPNAIGITLSDIALHDVVQQLELREHGTQNVLASSGSIYPLQPVIQLKKVP
jgi:hypothetical protein